MQPVERIKQHDLRRKTTPATNPRPQGRNRSWGASGKGSRQQMRRMEQNVGGSSGKEEAFAQLYAARPVAGECGGGCVSSSGCRGSHETPFGEDAPRAKRAGLTMARSSRQYKAAGRPPRRTLLSPYAPQLPVTPRPQQYHTAGGPGTQARKGPDTLCLSGMLPTDRAWHIT